MKTNLIADTITDELRTFITVQRLAKTTKLKEDTSLPVPNLWDALEMRYTDLTNQIEELKAEKEMIKQTIIEKFELRDGHQTASYTSNITGNVMQRVLSITQKINEPKLRGILPKNIWEKITVRKIDRDVFHAAIKTGEISATKVADVTTTDEIDKIVIRKNKK